MHLVHPPAAGAKPGCGSGVSAWLNPADAPFRHSVGFAGPAAAFSVPVSAGPVPADAGTAPPPAEDAEAVESAEAAEDAEANR